MQLATETPMPSSKDPGFPVIENETQRDARYGEYKIIRRNGAVVGFEPGKISVAVTKAFIAVNGGQGAASARVRELVAQLTESIVNALMPAPQAAWGKLCRTNAVVDATSDKNTATNNRPDASTTGQEEVSAGNSVANPNRPLSKASTWPPLYLSSRPAQMRDEATTAAPSKA